MQKVQRGVMKYVTTALAIVFTHLSPMVRKRLYDADQSQKAKLEVQSRQIIKKIEKKLLNVNSCHFMPLKWALHVIHEARERQEIDERLVNVLINEVNALHTACDRLINLRHETFAWGLTKGVMTSIYTFFVVGSVSTNKCIKTFKDQIKIVHPTDTPALERHQR